MAMQPEDVERLREQHQDTEVPPHAGLELAQLLAQIPEGDVELLTEIATTYARQYRVVFGTELHKILLNEINRHEKDRFDIRQTYFHALFFACIDDGKTVYPTNFTKMLNDEDGEPL